MPKDRGTAWVGREKACGCVVAICTDAPERADDIAEMIRDGFDVTKVSGDQLEAVLNEPTFLSCPHNGNNNPDQLAFDLGGESDA